METHDQIRDSAMDHYRNVPMHFTEILVVKIEKIIQKKKFFAQNIDCGYTHKGGCNKYPQSMFWSEDKKMFTPVKPICIL